jgi:hypothetical protein
MSRHLVRRKQPNTPSMRRHVQLFVTRIERPRNFERRDAERSPLARLPRIGKRVQFAHVSRGCQFKIAGRMPFFFTYAPAENGRFFAFPENDRDCWISTKVTRPRNVHRAGLVGLRGAAYVLLLSFPERTGTG